MSSLSSLNSYLGGQGSGSALSEEGAVLVYIDGHASARRFKSIEKLLSGHGIKPVVICSDGSYLKKAGIKGAVVVREAAHGARVADGVFERFSAKYRDWYMLDDGDTTLVDGYSLGFIHELDAYGVFKNTIWQLEDIKAVVLEKRPKLIITFFDVENAGAGLEPFFAEAGNAKVINIPPGGFSRLARRLELWYRLGYLGWLSRFVRAKLISLTRKGTTVSGSLYEKKYLFVYTGDSSSGIDSITPVAKEFGDGEVLHIADGERTRRELDNRGIPSLVFEDITGWGALGWVYKNRKPFIRRWDSAKGRLKGSARFDYKGINLSPFVIDELEQKIKGGAYKTLARAYALGRLIEKGKAGGLLVASDFHPVPREAVLVCRRHGVPSVEVIHGMVSVPVLYVPITADKIAVWGDEMHEWFVGHGTDPARLVTTGQPRYDGFIEYEKRKDYLKAGLGIEKDKKVVLYAASRLPGEMKTVETALDAIRQRKDTIFVIKPHPTDRPDAYERLLNTRPDQPSMVVSGRNIFEMLAICDIVLLLFSTVGLEAVLAGKPLVAVSDFAGRSNDNYVASGVALKADTAQELRGILDGLLSGSEGYGVPRESRERFIFRHNYKNDGMAARRVAGLLREMASSARRTTNQ